MGDEIDLLIGRLNGVPEEKLDPMFTLPTMRLGPTPIPKKAWIIEVGFSLFLVATAAVPTIYYMLWAMGVV